MSGPWLLAVALLVAPHGVVKTAPRPTAGSCTAVSISIDTTAADDPVFPFDTRGYGEVILCRDTIVTSITYWQPPHTQTLPYSARMYVTGTDALGRPNEQYYYIGPYLRGVDPDTAHAIPIVFSFSPPLVLPGAGRYFFDVKADDGFSCAAGFWLMADTTNRYVDGMGWWSGKLCDPCCPGSYAPVTPGFDMIFDIEFCDTHSTPTLARTWGQLKQVYR